MPSLGRVLERLTVAVDADTSEADRKLNDLSDESKGGSWIGKLGGGAAKAAGLMAVAVGAGAAAMGGLGLAAAAQAEQSEIAFTSIMGDAGKAKTFLADLSTFAAETPFELPGLKDAASRLLATGTEASKVIPIMRAVGDSTSAMGTGAEGIDRAVTALTQMQVKGKITGEEMLQLAEAGVPAWDALATVMGVSVAEAQKKVSAGQGNVNDLFKALETQAGPAMGRVKGMMDAQSASLTGMVSTLKDTALQGLGDMMKPAVQEIKKTMPLITSTIGDTLKSIGPQISTLMTGAVGMLAGLLPVIAPLVGTIAQVVGGLFAALGPALSAAAPLIAIVAENLGGAFLEVFKALAPIMPQVGDAIGMVAVNLGGALASTLSAVAPLFAQMLDAVLPLLPALTNLAQGALLALLPALVPLIEPMIRLATAMIGTAGDAGPLLIVLSSLTDVLNAVPTGVLTALAVGFMAFKTVGVVVGILAAIGPALYGLAFTILPALGGAFAFLVSPIALIVIGIAALAAAAYLIYQNWERLPELFNTVMAAVGGFFEQLPGMAANAVQWLADKFLEFAPKVIEAVGGFAVVVGEWLWGTALPWIGQTLWEGIKWLADKWLDLAQWTLDAVVEFAPKVAAWFIDTALPWLIGKFVEGIMALAQLFMDMPRWVVEALVEFGPRVVGWWFGTAVPAITDAVLDGIRGVARLFFDLPGMVVDAIGSLAGVGKDLIVGLWNGISGLQDWLADRVRNFARNAVSNVLDAVFDFGSPSKVMAQKGRWIGEGLGAGILASTGRVSAASDAMAAAATPGSPSGVVRPSFASSSTAASASASAAAAPNVFQLPDGSVLTMSEMKKRMRVLFIEDGGSNAFATALG